MVICVPRVGQGADLHMAQLIPLPFIVSCSGKSRLVLVPAHPGSPGQNAESHKMVVVVVVTDVIMFVVCLINTMFVLVSMLIYI